MYKILIIEDDIEIREELKILLQNSGYEVHTITDFNKVENQVFEIDSHLILLLFYYKSHIHFFLVN